MAQSNEHVQHAHPSNGTYVLVAAVLGVLTAVEVAVFYLEAVRPVLVPLLLTLSAAKFTMVVGFFMHLRFDSKLYRALFVGPLVVAIAVMIAMLFINGVFRL
ncbi:MAG: cytochrome C oxidase subunit IV family protein [Candidatus Palauibacterales bacterium]|nr:cytochrome C oxidase subunit IV family protein [Candidatus Palauibacterales bacterium]MDP2483728.1 cytochrome C oxidase subunit IV family protein [Candidatus Palauibacterales bacterium]